MKRTRSARAQRHNARPTTFDIDGVALDFTGDDQRRGGPHLGDLRERLNERQNTLARDHATDAEQPVTPSGWISDAEEAVIHGVLDQMEPCMGTTSKNVEHIRADCDDFAGPTDDPAFETGVRKQAQAGRPRAVGPRLLHLAIDDAVQGDDRRQTAPERGAGINSGAVGMDQIGSQSCDLRHQMGLNGALARQPAPAWTGHGIEGIAFARPRGRLCQPANRGHHGELDIAAGGQRRRQHTHHGIHAAGQWNVSGGQFERVRTQQRDLHTCVSADAVSCGGASTAPTTRKSNIDASWA